MDLVGTLIFLLIVLAIVGLVLWGIQQIPAIPPPVKVIIYVIVGIILLLWVYQQLGAHHPVVLR